jgi:uncharacterized protein YggE
MEVKMLKRVLFVAVTIALIVPLALGAIWLWGRAVPTAEAQTAAPTDEPKYDPARTVTVVGQGSTRVVPNIAQISIGVETSADTVADATKENQVKMKALLAALKKVGILDKDIQTMNYSITLNQYPQPQPTTESGTGTTAPKYTVSNMVTVTMRDLTLVSAVIDAGVEAGANNIWGINFTVDKPEAALADARTKAVADAKARAEALAGLGGLKLGPVMSMSEVVGSGQIPMAMSVERGMGDSGTSISPGEVEVSYQVQVVYFLGE